MQQKQGKVNFAEHYSQMRMIKMISRFYFNQVVAFCFYLGQKLKKNDGQISEVYARPDNLELHWVKRDFHARAFTNRCNALISNAMYVSCCNFAS